MTAAGHDWGMPPEIDIDDLQFVQRLTLLSITQAVLEDDDPIDSRALKLRSADLLESADPPVVSDPSERDVMRALGALGAEPYVEEEQHDQSPTGKGRPQYTLASDPDDVLDALAADEQLSLAVEHVRE